MTRFQTMSACAVLILVPAFCAASDFVRQAVYELPQLPEADRFVQQHQEHFTGSRYVDTLGHTQEHSFTGSPDELNRFLRRAAGLRRTAVVVTFTGPQGVLELEPLTPASAQSPAQNDWQVQVQQHHKLIVTIPLASRIPFAEIHVPERLKVEAYDSAPIAARRYAILHERRRISQ